MSIFFFGGEKRKKSECETMITKILEAVRAQTRDDTDESEKYLTTNKWEWSFLRVSLNFIIFFFKVVSEIGMTPIVSRHFTKYFNI